MPPPSDQQTRKLLSILANENSKTGTYQRQPSVFRETWNDTHKTVPVENWGPSPSLLPEGFQAWTGGPKPRYSASTMGQRKGGRGAGDPSLRRSQSATNRAVEYRSVFQPRPEQQHICSLARTHRDNIKGSEWALLETLEVKMYMDERAQQHEYRTALQTATRRNLDGQMQEREMTRQLEERDRAREGQVVLEQVAQFKEEERRKAEEVRMRNTQLKNEQTFMLQTRRESKQRALSAKQADELSQLNTVQAQLEEERKAAMAKMETTRRTSLKNTLENDLRIKARIEAEAAQGRREEEVMQQGMRDQERKEAEREGITQALFDKAQARANRAGQQVVAERRDREEREQRLIHQSKEQKEREYLEKERKQKEKREQQKNDLLNARKEYLALKEHRAAAERAEVARLRQEAEEKDIAEREAETRKFQTIRDRANNNKMFLTTQMGEKETKLLVDDVGMSERERYLNLRLLEQAVKIVGTTPKQLPVEF